MANILNFPLGDITPTAGNLLIASGSAWITNSLSGNVTINSSGVTTIGSSQVTNSMLAGGIDLTSKVINTLPFSNGGLGFSTATLGDLFYASATNTPGTLSDVAIGSVLASGGIGAAPSWSSSPTLTGLTLSGLAVSEAVVTNGSGALASLAYGNAGIPNTLVQLDSSGNFSAGTITAALSGNATSASAVATNSTTSAGTYYVGFFPANSSSNQVPQVTSGFTFIPSNGTGTDILSNSSYSNSIAGSGQAIRLNGGNISFLSNATSNDSNHGVGYYGSGQTKSWNGLTNVDGPVLFGFTGVVLGISNGTVSVLHATKTQINLFDTGGSALSGNNPALIFNSVLSAGSYINLGGAGRNIGVKHGGNHFLTNNLDYNPTTPGYQYVGTNAAGALEVTASGTFTFLTAPSGGTAGAAVTPTTQFTISNNGAIQLRTGSNGYRGSVTLSGSSTVVSTTAAATGCFIGLSNTGLGGTQGLYSISISNGSGFTITPSNGSSDTSTLQWFIMS